MVCPDFVIFTSIITVTFWKMALKDLKISREKKAYDILCVMNVFLRKNSYIFTHGFSFSDYFLDVKVSLSQSGVAWKCSSENTFRQMQ